MIYLMCQWGNTPRKNTTKKNLKNFKKVIDNEKVICYNQDVKWKKHQEKHIWQHTQKFFEKLIYWITSLLVDCVIRIYYSLIGGIPPRKKDLHNIIKY